MNLSDGKMLGLYRRGFKRLFDAGVALIGLVVFATPMGWIAWRIRREGGFVLFRQARVGHGGKVFTILKFRTLAEAGEVLSPLGEGLRASAMDELPQLINILRGQMSFVGPRPLIPDELLELSRIPGGARRLEVRPGLTGLAQLYTDKTPSLEQRLRWDLAYVDRCSFGLDLRILLKSVGVSLRGRWEQPGSKVGPPKA